MKIEVIVQRFTQSLSFIHTVICRMAWLRRKLLWDWLRLTLWTMCGWLCKRWIKPKLNDKFHWKEKVKRKHSTIPIYIRVCWGCWLTAADDDWFDVDWLFTDCTDTGCTICCWACWFCGVIVVCDWGVKSSCGDIIGTCSLFDWFCFDNLFCESRKFCFVSVGLLFVTIGNKLEEKMNRNKNINQNYFHW